MGENDVDVQVAVLKERVDEVNRKMEKAETRFWAVAIVAITQVVRDIYDMLSSGNGP